MKRAETYLADQISVFPPTWKEPALRAIESAQREAWNEAIKEAASKVHAAIYPPGSEEGWSDYGATKARLCRWAEGAIRSLHREEE